MLSIQGMTYVKSDKILIAYLVSSKVWKSDKPTHPESSNASHNLPALELLKSQHSLEISSVCQGLLVELDCSHKSFKFHLVKSGDRQEITRKHNVVEGAYKHSLIKRLKTRQKESTARMRRRFSALS